MDSNKQTYKTQNIKLKELVKLLGERDLSIKGRGDGSIKVLDNSYINIKEVMKNNGKFKRDKK